MNEEKIQQLIITWALKYRNIFGGSTLGMVHELSKEIMKHGKESPRGYGDAEFEKDIQEVFLNNTNLWNIKNEIN